MVQDVKNYVSVKKALTGVLSRMAPPGMVEKIEPTKAFGRVSAEEVRAPRDVPPYDVSHMDGFAIRSRDAAGAGTDSQVELKVSGSLGPGEKSSAMVRPGGAVRVSTGSYLPEGADTVVPIEEVVVRGKEISLRSPVHNGQFVFGAGVDVEEGETILEKGGSVRAQDIGLFLSLGIERVKVYARPRVAILATGNELTDSSEVGVGLVRNSHVPIFMRLMSELGCETLNLGISPDRKGAIVAKIRRGLRVADIVLTTGGTSVGRLDLAGDVVAALKPDTMFHGIRMDRGRVAGVAVVDGKPIVMMPGPVQGAMNAFVLFGLPLIRKASGKTGPELRVRARLTSRWAARRRFPNFTKVMYVKLSDDRGETLAEPQVGETESMTLLTKSNGFVIVPEKVTELGAGDVVNVLILPGFSFT